MGEVDIELRLEVEEHLALVHVPRDMPDGGAVDVRRDATPEGAALDAGPLDVDDVRPQRAEVHRRPWAHHDQSEVEYPDAF
jgi:hypothetical protein